MSNGEPAVRAPGRGTRSPGPRIKSGAVRCVPSWLAFSLAPALRSADSAPARAGLFAGFAATMAGSDFSRSCITGFGSSPSRCGPRGHRPVVERETSRFPCKERPYMPGSQTTQSRTWARDHAHVRVAFRWSDGVGAPNDSFRGSMAGLYDPLPTLRPQPRGWKRTARGRCGSLLLHRSGLSPPTPCRSPGAPDPESLLHHRNSRTHPLRPRRYRHVHILGHEAPA